ncbi:MAG: hypothetical protein A3F67_06310 [Verrucomicrobia bacterium RIFCSPHIGHO2_12_FULL_41_10]|nr:MAG: hypothetical protein A3F67_06310 [Verrucomicrobia bacterium RIFCSPHIGHO2_12_FULL_41_10]HLB33518.1 8-amino-7-oxononanoate synthase [Chthoniobacterales bacterium]
MEDRNYEKHLSLELAALKKQGLQRRLRIVEKRQGTLLCIDGHHVIDFSSNDYLGLSQHPALREAALVATRSFGLGATASRLIGGTTQEHFLLEEELASTKKKEAALLFSTGYAAATGAIPVLMKRGDVILLDKLAHASLIDGARTSEATLRIFRHNDMNHLEDHLKWAHQKFPQGRIMIVTESIFSMDGDLAPLHKIVELKERYDALLFLDEAHAVGVRGKEHQYLGGLAGELNLNHHVDIHMGTLGKALGVSGGYLCGSRILIDYLIHRARSFIYSTAPSPSIVGAARAALKIVSSLEGEERHLRLWHNIGQLTQQLNLSESPSAIMPLMIGHEEKALTISQELFESGYFIPAMRYPTVARGKARLRLTASANHTSEQITGLAHIFASSN